MYDVGDLQFVEARCRKSGDVLLSEGGRGRRQRHRSGDDCIPAFAEIGSDALVEELLHILCAL